MSCLFWFQNDLRVDDNPALCAAARAGVPLLCVYVLDDVNAGSAKMGAASRWWLHHALGDLHKSLQNLGLGLHLYHGKADEVIPALCAQHAIKRVFWNRHYEPWQTEVQQKLHDTLTARGVDVSTHKGSVLVEPWAAQTGGGTPFKVFTPFYKSCLANGVDARAVPDMPHSIPNIQDTGSLSLEALELLPQRGPAWHRKMEPYWDVSEAGAAARLHDFVQGTGVRYKDNRDRPDGDFTSRLSPYLHFGQISPRQIWRAAEPDGHALEAYTRQLFWREFSIHLLHHNPDLPDAPLQPKFNAFPWRDSATDLARWQTGQTGYPIVDAGMRQLWETGWMHNRVRMIVASFLVKHLLLPWQWGESWFWDTLVDADLANNSASWQWVAGCGADAAPYFRVFNPMLQGQKFDPNGAYVRRWCPELRTVPDTMIHTPWEHDAKLDYPAPIVEHAFARTRALEAYEHVKRSD